METKPAIEASLVQQFVGNAHGDLDRVKELGLNHSLCENIISKQS
jgi:hypothetical protein